MAVEVELKLELTPEAVDDFLECDLLPGETLEAPQDSLGSLNDAVSAPELLARLGLDKDLEAISLPASAEHEEPLVEAAAEAHDAFADAKPFWRWR